MKLLRLTKGKFAKVDDDIYEIAKQWAWFASLSNNKKVWYARRSPIILQGLDRISLHRFVMGLKKGDGKIVDHIDGDGLNCLRSNLRICTKSDNGKNKVGRGKSKYKCVHPHILKKSGKIYYHVSISIDVNTKKYIGYYEDEIEAALAANEAMLKYHGEFARLNVLEPQQEKEIKNEPEIILPIRTRRIEYKEGEKIGECYFISDIRGIIKWGQELRYANFKCYCGNEFKSLVNNVRRGQSCGCKLINHNKSLSTHGYTRKGNKHPDYRIWAGMKRRCFVKHDHAYKNYGGRGITVCDRWKNSFPNFLEDMGARPDKSYSLERLDNDKGYEKDNCKWATSIEQCNNTRKTIKVQYNGELVSIRTLSIMTGMPLGLLRERIRRYKYTVEDAISRPYTNKRNIA